MFKQLLLIGTGGFIGSVARYLVSRLGSHIEWLSIPVGTLVVNVAGSLLIGFLIGISEKSPILTVEWRMFLMVGLCGGFTTFSTFSGENLMLLKNGQVFPLLLYTGLSIILGFTAVYLGYISTKLMG
jgi:fluoride exporter